MIQDSNTLRGNYRMGIVKETFPSLDGKVRSVKIGYKNNDAGPDYNGKQYTYIERPVQKLIVIVPVDSASLETTTEHWIVRRECFVDIISEIAVSDNISIDTLYAFQRRDVRDAVTEVRMLSIIGSHATVSN